jgi:hypothetical protein
LDGRQQRVYRETRTWRNSYQVLGAWFDRNQELYEVFLDQLKGPVNTFNLPIKNRGPETTGETLFVTQSGSFWTEGGDFVVLDGDPNPVVTTTAPARATQITLDGIDGLVLQPGTFFSANDFAYRVATNTDGTITFNPPLREAIAADAVLEVKDPKIRVQLDGDAAADAAHQFSQIGAPQVLNVIEAFDR